MGNITFSHSALEVETAMAMTSGDIREGMMRITVQVALTRPAEFIEITFRQQMQKS
jgi:phage tail sheath protein FI